MKGKFRTLYICIFERVRRVSHVVAKNNLCFHEKEKPPLLNRRGNSTWLFCLILTNYRVLKKKNESTSFS